MVRVVKIAATPDPEWLVCLAARGDYMDEPPWEKSRDEVMRRARGKTLDQKMELLIKKLMLMGHWGPFEHPAITFGISNMSRVTLAQLTRHRIVSFDIQSARTVSLKDLRLRDMTRPPSFALDAVKTRDGGVHKIKLSKEDREQLVSSFWQSELELYAKLVAGGVPKEDARYVLSLAIPVHGTMTVNARSLMHIIAIRSFGDAQWEIRDLAAQLMGIAKAWMPITFRIFEGMMKDRRILAP